VCSPRPYREGLLGRDVRRRRYWDSNTRVAAEVSKRTSPVELLLMENEKGDSTKENLSVLLSVFPSVEGRGKTDSGT